MPVNLKAKKQLVSRIVGVGVNRVRFDNDHLDDIADAITRDDIRSLMTANTITIKSFRGTSREERKQKRFSNQNVVQHKVLKKVERELERVKRQFM